jgi:hypothetical protein
MEINSYILKMILIIILLISFSKKEINKVNLFILLGVVLVLFVVIDFMYPVKTVNSSNCDDKCSNNKENFNQVIENFSSNIENIEEDILKQKSSDNFNIKKNSKSIDINDIQDNILENKNLNKKSDLTINEISDINVKKFLKKRSQQDSTDKDSTDNDSTGKDSIGKNSIGKNSIGKNSNNINNDIIHESNDMNNINEPADSYDSDDSDDGDYRDDQANQDNRVNINKNDVNNIENDNSINNINESNVYNDNQNNQLDPNVIATDHYDYSKINQPEQRSVDNMLNKGKGGRGSGNDGPGGSGSGGSGSGGGGSGNGGSGNDGPGDSGSGNGGPGNGGPDGIGSGDIVSGNGGSGGSGSDGSGSGESGSGANDSYDKGYDDGYDDGHIDGDVKENFQSMGSMGSIADDASLDECLKLAKMYKEGKLDKYPAECVDKLESKIQNKSKDGYIDRSKELSDELLKLQFDKLNNVDQDRKKQYDEDVLNGWSNGWCFSNPKKWFKNNNEYKCYSDSSCKICPLKAETHPVDLMERDVNKVLPTDEFSERYDKYLELWKKKGAK